MPHTVLLVPINVSTLQSKRHGVKCGEMQSPAELSPKMKSSKDTPECTEDATGIFIFIFILGFPQLNPLATPDFLLQD